jgi:opacity protein-like surface antigen
MSTITQKLIKASLFLIVCISTNAQAEFFNSRVDKWEFFLSPQYTNAKTLEFDNGAEANFSELTSIAFGFGYNLNHHIELSLIFNSSSSSYTGTRVIDNDPEDPDNPNGPQKFSANMYTSSINFDFTYNFLTTPFTPYINATVGSTYIDSGIPTGNITTGCWWDPFWWGYVCGPVAQTNTTTKLNYGGGAGLRYDFNRKVYIKGGVSVNYVDLNSSNTPDFTRYNVTVGIMF